MEGKKTGGRKKGTPNKATESIKLKLENMGCDPVEAMAKIAMDAEAGGDTDTALRAYKELAQYVAPKLRSVEITEDKGEPEPMVFNFGVSEPKGEIKVTRGKD